MAAFGAVFGLGGDEAAVGLVFERGGGLAVERTAEGALAQAHRDGGGLGNEPRHAVGGVFQAIRRDDAVDEAHLQRLAGVHEARREDHLGGLGVADGGGEQQADPGIGSQGALGEHRREAGVLGGDADVAGQGESEAAAHGVP